MVACSSSLCFKLFKYIQVIIQLFKILPDSEVKHRQKAPTKSKKGKKALGPIAGEVPKKVESKTESPPKIVFNENEQKGEQDEDEDIMEIKEQYDRLVD